MACNKSKNSSDLSTPEKPKIESIEYLWRWLKGEVAANRTYTDIEPLKQRCIETLSSLTYKDALRVSGLTSG